MTDAVEFKNLSKSYGPIQACKNISFRVGRGSIHALVGENGAGKSTLMKILGGLEFADSGHMMVNEKSYQPQSAQDAFENKIGFIHQHFLLAENLTVLEHLILNWPQQKIFTLISNSLLLKIIAYFTEKFKWSLNLNSKIHSLSVGEQQRVEIIKALLSDPEIIIFDEPTAVLAPQEILDFLNFLKQLKSEGKTIILISHKLTEIQSIADQITILRHGESILTEKTSRMSLSEIAETMIGKKLNDFVDEKKVSLNKKSLIFFKKISLQLNQHEIVGVAGIEGHGQGALIHEILSVVKSKKMTYADISEDRLKYGIFEGLTLLDHMVLRHSTLSKNGFIQKEKALSATKSLLSEWDVRPQNIFLNADSLSGGNQQKFVIGRELFHDPRFILAAHPTRGVDLGAAQMIHAAFINQRNLGKSILLVSSDLDEILKLSDRFLILYKNKIYGPFGSTQLSETEIGQFMTGSHPEQDRYQQGLLL